MPPPLAAPRVVTLGGALPPHPPRATRAPPAVMSGFNHYADAGRGRGDGGLLGAEGGGGWEVRGVARLGADFGEGVE